MARVTSRSKLTELKARVGSTDKHGKDGPARLVRSVQQCQGVHEEGLEPPRLAAPEPKSGWRVSSCREMDRTGRFAVQFATVGYVSVRVVDDSKTIPQAADDSPPERPVLRNCGTSGYETVAPAGRLGILVRSCGIPRSQP
jgi:hypothetical protein